MKCKDNINPCKPCLVSAAPCEQCLFGYKQEAEKIELLRDIIEKETFKGIVQSYMVHHTSQ